MDHTKTTSALVSTPRPTAATERPLQRRAAVGAAIGFSGLAAFEGALALGAPLGRAAWGGSYVQLPTELRIASAVAVGIWLFAALLVLHRAGMRVLPLPPTVVHWGVWILVGLLSLGALMNFASPSVWERVIWGPFGLIVVALCIIITRGGATKS
jgi:hypothetical protein